MMKILEKKTGARLISFAFFFIASLNTSFAQSLPLANPESLGMQSAKLKQIDGLIEKDIADKKLPGAVVIIGRKGKIVYRKAYGNRSLQPKVEKMTIDTIFDAASITKPVATATSIMILIEQGKLRLSDSVGKFIPEIKIPEAKNITIQQLLTHTSGYAPDFDLKEKWSGQEGMLNALYKEKLRNPPGSRFVYSDIGFIVLGEIVKRMEGKTLLDFVFDNQLAGLKMNTSGFVSRNFSIDGRDNQSQIIDNISRVAPTENIRGQQNYLGSKFEGDEKTGNEILRGRVHDPTAFRMGGVAGHAGLFTTADDLARYCQMILNGGILDGKRILSASSVALMTKPNVVSESGQARGLGFDINTQFSSNRGELFPLGSFGHTGFTGNSIWIDPNSQSFVVFLSNRVHPDGRGDVTPLRAKVATIAASAIADNTPAKIREAEALYNAEIARQIPAFKMQLQLSALPGNTTSRVVLNGIDAIKKNNFKELEGLKVGLITNHTGKDRTGKQTIDILREAKNVKLISLFSPEHGIRGELDQARISDSIDEKTGLPIYSLYGETRRPKPEQLQGLDAIIFDIQDIGTRFYTYISTLRYAMEEASKAKIKVFVLDRANPINGIDVEGPIGDGDKLSFIAAHPIPVRHGMTVGELALMMNDESKIGADLKIIKIENWERPMWFDQINQTWVNPSPNMRSLTEATLYGGIGLLEFTNISVGRGTDTPFEIIGAPWIDGQRLALYLNERGIPGVRFIPVKYRPKASVFKDEDCGGVNIVIINRSEFKTVRTGIEIAAALRFLYPNDWKMEKYANLLVNQGIYEKLKAGESPGEIEAHWQAGLQAFKERRQRFLLYK